MSRHHTGKCHKKNGVRINSDANQRTREHSSFLKHKADVAARKEAEEREKYYEMLRRVQEAQNPKSDEEKDLEMVATEVEENPQNNMISEFTTEV